jgi:glycosyltransferase involved in cell wall biosynthesis
LLQPDDPREQAADRHELACMRRYDGLIVSSAEDQVLLGCLSSCLVANGIDISLSDDYVPSTGKRAILFVGPFRAPINFEGIVDFLKRVYPRLLSDVEGVSLTIVGGVGARARVANLECFAHPSIQLLEQVEDIPDLIRAHAVTINPQESLRGSSLKVIESLAVGRVCVSTRAGARGHLDASFDALLVADDEVEFARVLAEILLDDARRVQLERPQSDRLAPYDWSAQGRRLRDYLGHCIATTDAT